MVLIFNDKFSEQLQQEVCDAVNFFSDQLFSTKLSKHLVIELELKSYFKDHGDCEVLEYNSQRKPRSFKIRLRKKKSHKSLIKTLAHELVHVKQFALGEMSEFHDRWRDGVDHKETDYYDLPWEIEARMMEHVLYDKYKNSGLPKKQDTSIIEDNMRGSYSGNTLAFQANAESSILLPRSTQEYYGVSLSSDVCSGNALQEQ
jgi:hypothetical protein